MKENKQKLIGYVFAVTAVFFWGITFVSTKYLLNDFSALEILFFRFITAYIGLLVMHPKFEKIGLKDNILFALAGLSGVVLYQLFENTAIHFTNASNVSVIVSISPLFTAILSQLFFKEKNLSFWFILGFIISVTGVTLVCFNGNTALEFNPKGDLLALMSGICWGFYSVVISIINRKKYDPLCSSRRIFFFAVLIMIPLSFMGWGFSEETAAAGGSDFLKSLSFTFDKTVNAVRFSNPYNWMNLLFLGVIASGLCFTVWNKACKIVGTVKVSCGIYLIPVVTIVFAFFVLGEEITLLGGIGALVTIVGLFISEKSPASKAQALKRESSDID
ncbi:MAG: DMT family transporter [Treponemataceae bacterium]|nr:DMT family transporter [Treponemataceae bacterium]